MAIRLRVGLTAWSPGKGSLTMTGFAPTITVVPPPGSAPDWRSRWTAGLGNADAIVQDAGQWDGVVGAPSGASDKMYVIPNPGNMGFPSPATMPNLLRVLHNETQNARNLFQSVSKLNAVVGIGEFAFYRVYYHCAFPNNFNPGIYHHIQNGLNNLTWEWTINNTGVGYAEVNWYPITTPEAYPWIHVMTGNASNGKTQFLLNHTYRVEWRLENIDGVSARVEIRIFDEAVSKTVPIFTNADFWATDSTTLNYSNSPTRNRFNIVNGAGPTFGLFTCGNNGPSADPGRAGNNYEYYADFATKRSANPNDWIMNFGHP